MNLTIIRQLIPVMLLGLFLHNPSANAQTRATSPKPLSSMKRSGEYNRILTPTRHRLSDRLVSPAALEHTKQGALDGMTLSTRPGGLPITSEAFNDTYFVFDESYLNAIAYQYDNSVGSDPGTEEWQTSSIVLYDRTETGRLVKTTETSDRFSISDTEWVVYNTTLDYSYDSQGRLEAVTEISEDLIDGPDGEYSVTRYSYFTEFEYDSSGRLSVFTDIYDDPEDDMNPDTVTVKFTYGADSISYIAVSTAYVDTSRGIVIEGENLTFVATYNTGDGFEETDRETYYGVPNILTFYNNVYFSTFFDYTPYLYEYYDEEIDSFVSDYRIRHSLSDGQVGVFHEEYGFDTTWELQYYSEFELDASGNPTQLVEFYSDDEDDEIYSYGDRYLYNPDPEFLQFTSLDEEPAWIPTSFELAQNYPNPFNPSTEIAFTLTQPGAVSLRVFDAVGREVAVLVDAPLASGRHSVTFDATGLPSGIYYYRLAQAGSAAPGLTRSMVLLK